MQLLIVRHAQSANNKLHAETGETAGRLADPPITELGIDQSLALSQAWGTRGIPRPTHVYSSLMRRTIESAAATADLLDVDIVARTDTFECSGPYVGPWEDQAWDPGSARSVLQDITVRVQLPEQVTEDGWYRGPFEVDAQGHQRAKDLIDHLRRAHPAGDVVALFTHGAFGAFLMQEILGSSDFFCYQANTGHSLFTLNGDGGVDVSWMNRVDHLAPEQITGV